MTRPDAPSGTDRVAEVARRMTGVDVVVNVQGDEPEIAGRSIDLAVACSIKVRRPSCPPWRPRSETAASWRIRRA